MPAIVPFDTMPQLFTNLADYFAGQNRAALGYKDRNTKEWVDISWEQFRERVHAMAGYLHKIGVRPGDRVAILSENRPEWAVTDMATQILGGVNVSLYTSLPAAQVAYILQDSGAKVFIVSTSIQLKKAEQVFDDCPELEQIVAMSELRKDHPDYVSTWDDAVSEGACYWQENEKELLQIGASVQPDDLSALIYTSGTTGRPKGVMLTHKNFSTNARNALSRIPFGPEDHHLSFLPLCHSFERTCGYVVCLSCGAKITYAESIDAVSRNLVEVSPTVMISVPAVFEKVYNAIVKSVEEGPSTKERIFNWAVSVGKRRAALRREGRTVGPLLRAEYGLAQKLVFSKLHERLGGNLRFAVSGGAALPRAIGEFFEAAGIAIIEGYGLTETAPILTINPYDRPRYGAVGYVVPGSTIGIQRLSDGHMVAQQDGDEYPSSLTSDEEGEILARGPNIMKGYWKNDEATREAIDRDGWYHTGDIGRFDNGFLLITDRIKHMMVSAGGKNIYPGPIEEQFKTVPWIEQIVVIGEGRDFLTALVVPKMDALQQYAREQGISYSDEADLLASKAIQDFFEKEFRTYSRGVAAHEKIRDFRLLTEPFTFENELLTLTLKPRRKLIEKKYAPLIDEMYAQFAER